jgi:16S rRNA (guanine(527)-N(7))-methyltransferase RsmG
MSKSLHVRCFTGNMGPRATGSERGRPGPGQVLAPLLRRLGLPETLLSPLLAHAAAVARARDRLGLVSRRDATRIERRHTADSLLFALVRTPRPGERWVDVGSGAGFPGVPLACCYPATRFTLVEADRRRAGFLSLQAADLGLANVEVVNARAERLAGQFDVAVSRALGPGAWALLRRLVRPGGAVVLAVGPDEPPPPGATVVRVPPTRGVDSPTTFLMMGPAHEPDLPQTPPGSPGSLRF